MAMMTVVTDLMNRFAVSGDVASYLIAFGSFKVYYIKQRVKQPR